LAHWIGAQGRVKFAKKAKTPPLLMSPTNDNLKPKTKNMFFQSQRQDLLNPQRVCTALKLDRLASYGVKILIRKVATVGLKARCL